MEKKATLEEAREAILKAIKAEDYIIAIEGPDNLGVREHKDGSSFIIIYDMDDARCSNNFGNCTVQIAGYTFVNDFEEGSWTCEEDDSLTEDEDLMEAIEGIEGVISGEYIYSEDQVALYNLINGTDISDYYWYEDYREEENQDED